MDSRDICFLPPVRSLLGYGEILGCFLLLNSAANMTCGRGRGAVGLGGKSGARVIVGGEMWGLAPHQKRLFKPNTGAHTKIPKRPSILQIGSWNWKNK
jgi:hypothetical protein